MISLRPLAVLATTVVLTTSAFAQTRGQTPPKSGGSTEAKHSAPEIDVGLTGAAAALLLGGVFVFTSARRKKLAAT